MPKPADLAVTGLRRRYVLTAHPQLSSTTCARLLGQAQSSASGAPQVAWHRLRCAMRRRGELAQDIPGASGVVVRSPSSCSRARLREIRRMPPCIADVFRTETVRGSFATARG